jgi:hypothetical protein
MGTESPQQDTVSALPGTWYPRGDISSAQDTASSYPDSLSARTSSLLADIQLLLPGTEFVSLDTLSVHPDIPSLQSYTLIPQPDRSYPLVGILCLPADIQYQPPGTVYLQPDNLSKTPDILSSQQDILYLQAGTLCL